MTHSLPSLVRNLLLLAIVGIAGFALGACGGGQGVYKAPSGPSSTLPTRPTAPIRTATRPGTTITSTSDSTTTRVTTTHVTTTVTEPTTTEVTTTVTQPTTTTTPGGVTVQTTTQTRTIVTVTGATSGSESSSNNTPWAWIILGAALVGAIVVGIVLWRRRRAGASSWVGRSEDLRGRVLRVLDEVLAEGSVVTGQVQALASEARSLEEGAPDDSAKSDASRLRMRLDELASVLESDRRLRLSSPPPTPDQLTYSTASIREQVEQLQDVLRPPGPAPDST